MLVHVDYPTGFDTLEIDIVFPDFYPELRFEVYAPTLELGRHQNPFGKNLCLIDRNTRAWNTSYSAAEFLTNQVPKLLRLVEDQDPLSQEEVPQGEPFTEYYSYTVPSIVFVPDAALSLPRESTRGWLHLQLESGQSIHPVRALLREVQDRRSNPIARADEALLTVFSHDSVPVRWFRLDGAPQSNDPTAVLQCTREQGFDLQHHWQAVRGRRVDIIGMVFQEEVEQGRYEDAWLFVVQDNLLRTPYFSRAQRLSATDLGVRIPELSLLRDATIGVLGLGAIGAPSVLELAKAQIREIRLWDHDIVDVGTIARWPFGLVAAGHNKSLFLRSFLESNYPYTKVTAYSERIGRAEVRTDQPSERELLGEFLDGLDLIYDATGEYGVQYLISNLARDRKIPQVYVSGTEGGWGGAVARCIPEATGCWWCWKQELLEGNLPTPPRRPDDSIQPRGCGTPTFTGSSFDLMPVVSHGIRVTIQTVLQIKGGRRTGVYPPTDYDLFLFANRDADGRMISAPQWQQFRLPKHSACPYCN